MELNYHLLLIIYFPAIQESEGVDSMLFSMFYQSLLLYLHIIMPIRAYLEIVKLFQY